jgi:hypothetical protein
MNLEDAKLLSSFCSSIDPALAQGMNMDQIIELLAAAGLADRIGKFPITATLQLICRNHEVLNDEFIFRECRTLGF